MSTAYLGIDISKAKVDVALLRDGQNPARGQFKNNATGFAQLGRWLKKRGCAQVHACMEATGHYWLNIARYLHEAGHLVSVVNPKLIKRHGQAIMQRNKTDRQDAWTIGDYCRKHQPPLWQPPAEAWWQLRALVRHVQVLKTDRTREVNRRQSGIETVEVLAAIEAHIAFLDEQIDDLETQIRDHIDNHPDLKRNRDLLLSIPGIGETTAAAFLAELPNVSLFSQARQVAAFAGLTPGERQSGTSLKKSGRLVKWGNARLRTAFFMPALCAHRYNPIIAAYRERLLARGKSKMTVVIAVMRKLLHLCYGVIKTGKPFDPNHGQLSPI